MHLLKVDLISRKENSRIALQPTSFFVDQNEKLAIMGETGSGKSTLLKIIAGLIQPSSGSVEFENTILKGPDEVLIPGHPAIAYLSQHFELRNNYFVHELLEMASKVSDDERNTITQDCKINHVLFRKTNELSGGERQRVALAKTLVSKPRLLLLDEPFTNLDMQNKMMMNEVIHAITSQNNITCILVSHDPVDVLSWAERILLMKDGEIIQSGSPTAIYLTPSNDYAASLLGPFLRIDEDQKELRSILEIPNNRTYLRPEEFEFSINNNSGLKGEIKSKNFCGPYTRYTISSNSISLQIHSAEHYYQIGNTVLVKWKNNA